MKNTVAKRCDGLQRPIQCVIRESNPGLPDVTRMATENFTTKPITRLFVEDPRRNNSLRRFDASRNCHSTLVEVDVPKKLLGFYTGRQVAYYDGSLDRS